MELFGKHKIRLRALRDFLQLESAGGMVLLLMACLALLLTNSPWSTAYFACLETPIAAQPVLFWINDGLMAIFFLLVGLELKREFLVGELQEVSRVVLPGAAAIGGMVVPALIYYGMNWHRPDAISGWSVPVATDIAFALGLLSLFGRRVPLGLKLFLLALAIFDDVGAILIIAFKYTSALSYLALFGAVLLVCMLLIMGRVGVRRVLPYLLVGVLLWWCVLVSGVHPTIAGVVLALCIPIAPLQTLEKKLHPWVAFGVMPLFALANAGLVLPGAPLTMLQDSVTLGVIAGLLVGKQLGVFGVAYAMIKMGWAKLPENTSWFALYGAAILCGIGFTMSLFLGTLALHTDHLMNMRLGVLMGSLMSGMMGLIVLRFALQRKGR